MQQNTISQPRQKGRFARVADTRDVRTLRALVTEALQKGVITEGHAINVRTATQEGRKPSATSVERETKRIRAMFARARKTGQITAA